MRNNRYQFCLDLLALFPDPAKVELTGDDTSDRLRLFVAMRQQLVERGCDPDRFVKMAMLLKRSHPCR